MTVPGIDATVALSIVAAVGDFTRFRTPDKLVAYLGLNPRVRQSGGQPASHGRITKAGPRTPAACWSRRRGRRPRRPGRCGRSTSVSRPAAGMQIAVVADRPQTHRAVLAPDHQGEDLRLRQPSLVAHKRASSSCALAHRPREAAKARPLTTRSRPCAQPNATWPLKPRPPTAR
jgi:hypothetical protein